MNKIISYIRHCCCLLLLVVNTSIATAQDDSTLNQRLQLLLQDEIFETSTVGIKVYDLTADSTLFAYNDRQLMRPASTLKMMVKRPAPILWAASITPLSTSFREDSTIRAINGAAAIVKGTMVATVP